MRSEPREEEPDVTCPKCGALWEWGGLEGRFLPPPPPPPQNQVRYGGDPEGEWLVETCYRCGYAFRRPCLDAADRAGGGAMAETITGEPFPELEYLCPACEGSGVDRKDPPRWFCPECDGTGYLPTDIGKKVLALMRHNFKPMLRDNREDD